MNQAQRKTLAGIVGRLETLKDEVEAMASIERDNFDAMPEPLQGSERGERMDEGASKLEDAFDDLDNALSTLEEIE